MIFIIVILVVDFVVWLREWLVGLTSGSALELVVNLVNVAVAQSIALPDVFQARLVIFRHYCRLAVLRCGFGAVVHDRLEVVRCAKVVEVRRDFVELILPIRIDVVPQDSNEFISIRPIVHVNVAQSVQQLMNHNPTLHALAFVEHDVLTSPNATEMRPTMPS